MKNRGLMHAWAVVGVAALAGCGFKGTGYLLTEEDYESAAAAQLASGPQRPVVSVSGPPNVPGVKIKHVEASPDAAPADVPVPGEDVPAPVAVGPPAPDLIDAKVGDINGRPVFAQKFFEQGPGQRLAQEAAKEGVTLESWRGLAIGLIRERLDGMIMDEVVEAEARASLEPRQKQGLRALLGEWRAQATRESGGSATLLEQKLQAEQNKNVEQWLRDREARALIEYQIKQKIEPRSIVSWQDIQLYYERNYKRFNPDPVARFRRIQVPLSNEDGVQAVQSALDRGEPFAEVAAGEHNAYGRSSGGLDERTLVGGRETANPFRIPAIDEAARTLEVGRWTRVDAGGDAIWLYLESVEQVSRPLSDRNVQLEIAAELAGKRWNEELRRYVGRLRQRASFTDVSEMTGRLLAIAEATYWNKRPAAP
jgi:hypothetical protein